MPRGAHRTREQEYPRKHWRENAAELAGGPDGTCYVAESDEGFHGMAIDFRDEDDPSSVWPTRVETQMARNLEFR